MSGQKYTNALVHESSPYLLQHAHNPVNWMPWGETALQLAEAENKLILISIGYSACHWCHVMEHESFEDPEVARIMNAHYVCIKIDREERPDIDQIYMNAVQILTGRGGWPLNCIALPDRRPIWGGTYFPKESWIEALLAVAKFYSENKARSEEYAAQLQSGMEQNALVPITPDAESAEETILPILLKNWKSQFDTKQGGANRVPKFMLPNNWQFLLRAAVQFQDKYIQEQVELTLRKMAFGGIFDQIGGGFSRYSTDEIWKVPHFEKMLYDNAQLLVLYSEAYKQQSNPLYKQVVAETISFLKRELLAPDNGFYSALDADSEGVEGKFYVWNKTELEKILGADYPLFSAYYNINELGFWEHGNYILFRTEDDLSFAVNYAIEPEDLKAKVLHWKQLLLQERAKRVRPGLDIKVLTSWNGMTISGLISAYQAFGDAEYLELALNCAGFILNKLKDKDGRLHHSFQNNQAKIDAFLEDYAFTIEAFVALFETTGSASWLEAAQQLTEISLHDFFDHEKAVFYFTSHDQTDLISRTFEIHDQVIPASNSVMARNLVRLSYLLENNKYRKLARKMLRTVSGTMAEYPSGYSNWSQLLLDLTGPHYEVVLAGPNAFELLRKFQRFYLPQVVFCAGTTDTDLPLLRNRFVAGKTLIYICQDNTCQLPVETVEEALRLIQN